MKENVTSMSCYPKSPNGFGDLRGEVGEALLCDHEVMGSNAGLDIWFTRASFQRHPKFIELRRGLIY